MYTDDLILITHATRSAAQFVKLCLHIYGQLTSQFANASKSGIFFPSWANVRSWEVFVLSCPSKLVPSLSLTWGFLFLLRSLLWIVLMVWWSKLRELLLIGINLILVEPTRLFLLILLYFLFLFTIYLFIRFLMAFWIRFLLGLGIFFGFQVAIVVAYIWSIVGILHLVDLRGASL